MDLFTTHGLDVAVLEEEGVILPLVSMEIRYVAPLHFRDRIIVETILKLDNQSKLELKYRIVNQDQKLVARATTAMVFVFKYSS